MTIGILVDLFVQWGGYLAAISEYLITSSQLTTLPQFPYHAPATHPRWCSVIQVLESLLPMNSHVQLHSYAWSSAATLRFNSILQAPCVWPVLPYSSFSLLVTQRLYFSFALCKSAFSNHCPSKILRPFDVLQNKACSIHISTRFSLQQLLCSTDHYVSRKCANGNAIYLPGSLQLGIMAA